MRETLRRLWYRSYGHSGLSSHSGVRMKAGQGENCCQGHSCISGGVALHTDAGPPLCGSFSKKNDFTHYHSLKKFLGTERLEEMKDGTPTEKDSSTM